MYLPPPNSPMGKLLKRVYSPVWINTPPHPNSVAGRLVRKLYFATVFNRINPKEYISEYTRKEMEEEEAYLGSILQRMDSMYCWYDDEDDIAEWVNEDYISWAIDYYEEETDW